MMTSIYFIRHQAAGILVEFPFATKPTEKQIDMVARLCRGRHGEAHPKTKEPYWFQIVEMKTFGADDVINEPVRESSISNEVNVTRPTVSGTGHVENPKESK